MTSKLKKRSDYKPPAWIVPQINLHVTLDAVRTKVIGTLTIIRNPNITYDETSTAPPLVINGGLSLEVEALYLNDVQLTENDYIRDSDTGDLTVNSQIVEQAGGPEIAFRSHTFNNPTANTSLQGLFLTKSDLSTQCEPFGFRNITFHIDRPDVLSLYRVTLVGDPKLYPVMLCNGNKISQQNLDDSSVEIIYDDPSRKPSSIFAIVAGQFQNISSTFKTMAAGSIPEHTVDVSVWSSPEDIGKLQFALDTVLAAMKWDEEAYGRVYELDYFHLVAIADFNYGAMENKGLNIFASGSILADKSTATDGRFFNVQGTVAHEYLHNWTGNRISLRDWFEMTLKEGFTTYRTDQFCCAVGNATAHRIDSVVYMRSIQYMEDMSTLSHPIRRDEYYEVENFYTATVYHKGAEVFRMLNTIAGDNFRPACDEFFDLFDGQPAVCEDFLACVERHSKTDLKLFQNWFSQRKTPRLKVLEKTWIPEVKKYKITLMQIVPPSSDPLGNHAGWYHIPVVIGLIGKKSKKDVISSFTFHMTQETQTVEISDVTEDCIPSLMRSYSAPIILDDFLTDEENSFLLSYDTDPFNRWESSQALYISALKDRLQKVSAGATVDELEPLSHHLVAALSTLLGELLAGTETLGVAPVGGIRMEPDYTVITKSLTLPTTSSLVARFAPCDPLALAEVVDFTRVQIATTFFAKFLDCYRRLTNYTKTIEYAPTSTQAGIRSVRNICLDYCVCGNLSVMTTILTSHHDKATNFTDEMAGLSCMVNYLPETEELMGKLGQVFTKYDADDLVIDKCFSLIAHCRRNDSIDLIEEFAENHKYRESKNPSRVNSLNFAENLAAFHRKDGRGYRLFADKILEVDKFNPLLASRMARSLCTKSLFTKEYAERMELEINRICKSQEPISSHLSEVLEKN